jgi:hypothetical protein
MQLVVVGVGLEVTDDLLPVGREDVFICTVQALVDLVPGSASSYLFAGREYIRLPTGRCTTRGRAHSLGPRAGLELAGEDEGFRGAHTVAAAPVARRR